MNYFMCLFVCMSVMANYVCCVNSCEIIHCHHCLYCCYSIIAVIVAMKGDNNEAEWVFPHDVIRLQCLLSMLTATLTCLSHEAKQGLWLETHYQDE